MVWAKILNSFGRGRPVSSGVPKENQRTADGAPLPDGNGASTKNLPKGLVIIGESVYVRTRKRTPFRVIGDYLKDGFRD